MRGKKGSIKAGLGQGHAAAESSAPGNSKGDPSKSIAAVWIPIIVAPSAAIGGAARSGFEQHEIRVRAVQEATRQPETENQRLLNEYLTKIKVQLTESKSIYNQLAEQYLEPGWGILESYVIKARRDGSAKNALMFALMTDLVGRDSKIAELLEGYAPSAITTEFKTQSDEFLEHARTYVLRFGVLSKVISAGEQLPVWKPFPSQFPVALEQEIDARKHAGIVH